MPKRGKRKSATQKSGAAKKSKKGGSTLPPVKTGSMGFEEGVSLSTLPTNPICQTCLEKGFGAKDNTCYPVIILGQIIKGTAIMVKLGLIQDGEMAKSGNNKQLKLTCFTYCHCLTTPQRRAFAQSATCRHKLVTVSEDPAPSASLVNHLEISPESALLAKVVNNNAYAISSDPND